MKYLAGPIVGAFEARGQTIALSGVFERVLLDKGAIDPSYVGLALDQSTVIVIPREGLWRINACVSFLGAAGTNACELRLNYADLQSKIYSNVAIPPADTHTLAISAVARLRLTDTVYLEAKAVGGTPSIIAGFTSQMFFEYVGPAGPVAK